MRKKQDSKKADIFGIKMPVMPASKLGKVDGVVCIKATIPLLLPDNKTAPCFDCGDMIQYRPYVPKKAKKICVDCFKILRLKHDDLELFTTDAQIKDIDELMKRFK